MALLSNTDDFSLASPSSLTERYLLNLVGKIEKNCSMIVWVVVENWAPEKSLTWVLRIAPVVKPFVAKRKLYWWYENPKHKQSEINSSAVAVIH